MAKKSSSKTAQQFFTKKSTSSKAARPADRRFAKQLFAKKKSVKSASAGRQSESSQSGPTIAKQVEKGLETFKKVLLKELTKTKNGCSGLKAFMKVNDRKPKIKTVDEFSDALLLKLGSEGDEVGVMRVYKILKEHNKGLLREANEQNYDEVVVMETKPASQSRAHMPNESESETEKDSGDDDDDSIDDNDEDYTEYSKPKHKRSSWTETFEDIVAYQKKHKHCNVREAEDSRLSRWVKLQKRRFHGPHDGRSEMSTGQVRKLISIGFVFSPVAH